MVIETGHWSTKSNHRNSYNIIMFNNMKAGKNPYHQCDVSGTWYNSQIYWPKTKWWSWADRRKWTKEDKNMNDADGKYYNESRQLLSIEGLCLRKAHVGVFRCDFSSWSEPTEIRHANSFVLKNVYFLFSRRQKNMHNVARKSIPPALLFLCPYPNNIHVGFLDPWEPRLQDWQLTLCVIF